MRSDPLKRTAQYVLPVVLAASGLVIAVRVLLGPFEFPIRVATPLNAEGWFGLALTILMIARGTADARRQDVLPERGSARWAAGAVVVLIGFAVVSLWRAVHFFFLADDFFLVSRAAGFHFALRPLLASPGANGFFRPAGDISLAWTWMWARVNPVAWHVTALSLHAVNVVLVFALACRLPISRPAAFFCAALFAAHGTRPEAAAWIAGRFDLVATFFVLMGLLLFLRTYAAAGRAGYIGRVLSLACMVLAVLRKESAYILPLLLVVLLMAKKDLSRKRVARVVPFFVAGAALFAYRLWLFEASAATGTLTAGERRL